MLRHNYIHMDRVNIMWDHVTSVWSIDLQPKIWNSPFFSISLTRVVGCPTGKQWEHVMRNICHRQDTNELRWSRPNPCIFKHEHPAVTCHNQHFIFILNDCGQRTRYVMWTIMPCSICWILGGSVIYISVTLWGMIDAFLDNGVSTKKSINLAVLSQL